MGMLNCLDQRVETELDGIDEFADGEKLQGNTLGFKFLDRLNAIDEEPGWNHIRKAREFGKNADKMIDHICNNDEAINQDTNQAFFSASS